MKVYEATFEQTYTDLKFKLKVECELDEEACVYFDSVQSNLPDQSLYVDGVGKTYATWSYYLREIN